MIGFQIVMTYTYLYLSLLQTNLLRMADKIRNFILYHLILQYMYTLESAHVYVYISYIQ